ncbi:fimbrial biogenesis chaperone [Alteromonas gilva]|uniref:Fimbria/pilus periplasmic chaperone n=1 Tax=Alteromonas gilva TaxID=2987522 RepID=A0ABT5L1T3_9ALTE|nr:fimbria/pilus periplasmic chaperone [Alteromonas gilva]MDC8829763.1 fimbria/pilus periplasmic chaperone [Alteromonas gilva]
MKKTITLPFIIVVLLLATFNAAANLLIYPVRVSFDENERTAELSLTNTSQATNTYRLSWRENIALAEGGYEEVKKEDISGLPLASPMLRFAPRQVTLKPGERQVIKLALRRPRDLADGEYRSHLLFKALPSSNDNSGAGSGTSMQINMTVSFAVPVSVQQGSYDSAVKLEDTTLAYDPNQSSGSVTVRLSRQGLHSSSGDISAFWTPDGGKEQLIAKRADYNLWAELDDATTQLVWAKTDFEPQDGTLRILYEGVRDFKGMVYVDETLRFNKSDIDVISQ